MQDGPERPDDPDPARPAASRPDPAPGCEPAHDAAPHAAGPARLGAQVARGASIFVAATMTVKLMSVVSIAFLGRLLSPFDFGVAALAMIVVGFNEAIVNRQFTLALIRIEAPGRDHFNTAFTLGATWGLAAAAAVFAAAGPAGRLTDTPQVAEAIRLLALIPLMDGLRNPYFVTFEKALKFRPAAMVEVAASLSLVLCSVALAFLLRSFWALVAGYLAQSAMHLILSHALTPQRPGIGLSRWREQLGFGGWLTGIGVLGFVGRRADGAMIGAHLSVAQVGQYNLGAEIAAMMAHKLLRPVQRAVYPGLATMVGDRERLRAAYIKTQSVLVALVLPIGVGGALAAHELVRVAAGPQWGDAAVVLQHLAPVLALGVLTTGVHPLAMVDGDTRRLFLRNVVIVAVTIPALALGLWLHGFMGVIYARMLTRVVDTALTLQIASRILGVWSGAIVVASRRTLAAAAIMAAAMLAAAALHGGVDTGPQGDVALVLQLLALKAAVGGLGYVAALALLWRAAGRPDGVERLALDFARDALRRARRRSGRGGRKRR